MGTFFIRRPVFAIVIAIVMILLGVVALGRLPIAQFPNIVPPEILVRTSYVGADAVTVEQAVATPLEQQINGVDNMLYVRSTNANDGTLGVRVTFEVGTDIDMDNVLTQNRVSQATASLPEDVKKYGVTVKKSLGMPFLVLSLYSPHETHDADFLGNYASININDELARIRGIGQVNVFGTSEYAMRIWIKPDQLASLGLTIADLRKALEQQNAVNPAGQVGGEPAPPGQEFTYSIRAQGRLVTAEEFGNVIVRETADGSVVRLKDVARIELGTQRYDQRGRLNGSPAAIISLYQTPGSNAIETAARVKQTMERLKERFPEDLDYRVSLDTTLAISAGITEIVHTLLEAVLLVVLVVFLFLQSWRATLIPLLTVPVSLVGAFAVFPLLGFSVNTLSLFGLVLAIGIVVDDAIVVVEAVEHHMEHGLSPAAATEKSMREVSGPVVAIALVLAAVFIPAAFVGGITGRLYQQFAVTIAVSVLLSAVNALSLSPALCALLLKPKKKSTSLLGRFFGAFDRAFDKITGHYQGLAGHLVRKTTRAVLLLGIFCALVGVLGKRLATGFVPNEDQGYLFVNVQLPDAASLQRTDAVCKKVEDVLKETNAIEAYNTVAGFSLLADSSATYSGFFFVQLKPWEERKGDHETADGVIRALSKRFSGIPDAVVTAFPPPAIPGVGTSGGFSLMLQDRVGGTPQELAAQTGRFLEAARKRPEIGHAYTLFRAAVPQVFADVDREKVLKQGIDIRDVYSTLQTFMGSAYVNDFNRFGRQWKVYMQAEPEYRNRPDRIDSFYVRTKSGEMAPLASVVTTRQASGPEYTNRFNLFRAAEIGGMPAPGFSSGQALAALQQVAQETLPREYGYAWKDMSYQQKVAGGGAGVFLLSVFMVFLILAAQYESWSLPFSVLLGTPLAVFGAFLGLALSKIDFDVYGQVGLIMLIGLSAKNAILIVEFARAEVNAGKSVVDAAVHAARLRLRPILMTAFAFILGCVPLLRATGAGAASRNALGTVVVYGMLVATILGVFLTPALFTLVEKLSRRGREGSPGPEVPQEASESVTESLTQPPQVPAEEAHV